MSVNNVTKPVSLSAKIYDEVVCKPLSERVSENLKAANGVLSHGLYDPKLLTVLKNLAYKVAMFANILLGSTEWIVRSAASGAFLGLSLALTPVEWIVRSPLALIHKRMPSVDLSDKIFKLAKDLNSHNLEISTSVYHSTFYLLFSGNHLTQGFVID